MNALVLSGGNIKVPLQTIGGQPYYDGGLRDIAPLKQAIELGATRVVCAL